MAGGAGQISPEDIQRHYSAVVNVVRYLGVLGEPEELVDQREFSELTAGIRAERRGFFTSLVSPGDEFKEGDILGTLTDAFDEFLMEIKSPIMGLLRSYISQQRSILEIPSTAYKGSNNLFLDPQKSI